MKRLSLVLATVLRALLPGGPTTPASAAPTAGPVVVREFIYESAPFPQCHASTIAETPSGLVAAWFGGTEERFPDVGIWVARREGPRDGTGGHWTRPVEVANGRQGELVRFPCWNPVLFQPAHGPLVLFYKVGPHPDSWWGLRAESPDGGRTWTPGTRLPAGIIGPVKNKPVQLADGSLLCPSSSEDHGWRIHFERTADLGRHWETTGPIDVPAGAAKISAIQPSILLHPGGRLQAVGRTREGRLFESGSADNGRHWEAPRLTDLPNPNSGTDAVTLADGRHLLLYNHTGRGRSPLNVALSADGRNWQAVAVLEDEPGEYSYPAVIQARDGRVHITYTWQRRRIRHVVLDPAHFQPRPIVNGEWPR